jgi:hypothetical protein
MAVEGSLDLFQLPEILQIISQEQKTGILTVQGQNDIIAISFLGGRMVAADALNSTVEDGLGEVLLQQNLLTRREHEAALAEKRRSGRRLMDVLEESGTLERAQLLEALRALTFELLEKLLTWRQGDFKFYSGEEVSYEEGFRPIRVEDLLLANLPQAAQQATPERPEPAEPEPPAELEKPVAVERPEPPAVSGTGRLGESAEERRPAEKIVSPGPIAPASSPWEVPSMPATGAELDLGATPLRPMGPPAEVRESRATPIRAPREEETAERTARRRAIGSRSRPVLAWGLGGLAAVALAAVVATAPTTLLLPFASSPEQRVSFEQSQREARYAKIESAVRSYALIEGRLPEDLGEIVESGMLPPSDVRGPFGQPLLYEADGLVYRIRPLLTEEQTAFLGSLRGDFLLDPNQLEDLRDGSSKPLVLLD